MGKEPKHTNALVHETSPYLLQHAHNPVDWFPWSEEALSKAQQEDKPILLSIGYSACHWCHVMEHESFENEDTAAIMNQHFVSIKVDREERPDLDSIYMSAVQMMTGHGGWPMTVFLSPDRVPFYGGTYFPPEDRHGMPGFPRLLLGVAQTYKEKRDEISRNASKIVQELQQSNRFDSTGDDPSTQALDIAVQRLLSSYDSQHGGFGGAPKFPPSMALSFLLRSHHRTPRKEILEPVEQTLKQMACGGLYDQLGGGFHRYSVDAVWLVPHFEKMLYDNALLSRIYLDAFLVTGENFYRRVAEETLDYVVREMTSPEGGFYSAQDADSEGEEGKFFVWTPEQIGAVLGETDSPLFCQYFDVTPEGNFEGKNILHVPRQPDLVARINKMDEQTVASVIERGKQLLFEAREARIKPARDEKILTAWNGLMLRSFAEAANVLDRPDYRKVARDNAQFLLSKLRQKDRLLRTYRDGEAKLGAYLEDHAFLMEALLSLYEATFESKWIHEAEELARTMVSKFWDEQNKGFYFTASDHEPLISRPKEFFDNAIPSGNSVACSALLRLSRLTMNDRWRDYVRPVLQMMLAPMTEHPSAFSHLLCALDFYLAAPREIAVIGNSEDPRTRVVLREVQSRYLPNTVVACGIASSTALLQNREQVGEDPTVYLCENYTCKLPITDLAELKSHL